jgi:hypothetical protein
MAIGRPDELAALCGGRHPHLIGDPDLLRALDLLAAELGS